MPRAPLASSEMFDGALREASGGVLVTVDARPGAAATRISGYNAWRGSVVVEVAAPPERGAANRELEAFLARLAGGGCTARVVRGATARRKTVLVHGASRTALAEAIARGSA